MNTYAWVDDPFGGYFMESSYIFKRYDGCFLGKVDNHSWLGTTALILPHYNKDIYRLGQFDSIENAKLAVEKYIDERRDS